MNREPFNIPLPYWLAIICVMMLFWLTGCAALPMALQPKETSTQVAEGAFVVLEGIDTAQTMHIRAGTSCDHEADPLAAALYGSSHPKPGRVLLTNVALLSVHAFVTSWLDDEVAKHAHDDSAGPWYVGRIAWHSVSLIAAGASVINNHSRNCGV